MPHLRSLALLPIGLAVCAASAQEFTATILHPSGYPGSVARAVFNGVAMGEANPGFGHLQAPMWTGPGIGFTDLAPSNASCSIYGASADSQVGWGHSSVGNHAVLWHGTVNSLIDLHPFDVFPEFQTSFATGVDGNTQVGYGVLNDGSFRAVLWHGSEDSAVGLQPAGFVHSQALAVSGNTQVGYAWGSSWATDHAVLWHGTSDSLVDLNPAGSNTSYGTGCYGKMQAGYAYLSNQRTHAFVWSGTPESAVDLTPGETIGKGGQAFAIAGDLVVGFGIDPNVTPQNFACVWDLAHQTSYNLHPFLPNPASYRNSIAYGVDLDGNVVGTCGDTQGNYAVIWRPVRRIAGTVTLQGLVANAVAGSHVTVAIRNVGTTTALDTQIVTLDSSGNFSMVTSVHPGIYDIALKGSHWLRKTLANRAVGVFGISGVNATLTTGDVNGDNVVSLGDIGALRLAFGATSLSSNWNPEADLNGDGVVSLGDIGLLRQHYGEFGDQ